MDNLKISLSTEPANNIQELYDYVKAIEQDSDYLHFDIMDGNFVDKKNFNYKDVEFIHTITSLPLDVHLMCLTPNKLINKFAKAGSTIITVHFEAFDKKSDLIICLKNIRKKKCLVGLSLKPKTKLEEIFDLLEYIDLCLIMSVEPGKSGQMFLPSVYSKIAQLNKYRHENNLQFFIEIDGGVNPKITTRLKKYGTDIIVSGNYVYKAKNRHNAIDELK